MASKRVQKGQIKAPEIPGVPRGALGTPRGHFLRVLGSPGDPFLTENATKIDQKLFQTLQKNDLVLVMVLALVLVLVLALVLVFVLVPALVGLASRGAPWAPQSPRGPIWTNLGAILVQFWCHLGSSWGAFGRNNNV